MPKSAGDFDESVMPFIEKVRETAGDLRVWVLGVFSVACAVGLGWGIPCTESWAMDALSPRGSGLGAIAETYWPGHYFRYPPLHLLLQTILALPWMLAAWIKTFGEGADAFAAELIHPVYMSGIELASRCLTASMGIGIVWNTMRLWTRVQSRRVGLIAAATVALNPILVFYSHTGNLDVPWIFWVSLTLVELDRVMVGESRYLHALLAAMAAALTKDQAIAALLLPCAFVLLSTSWTRMGSGRPAWRPRPAAVRAVGLALGGYALVSGAIVNPGGFRQRVAFLTGPASQEWTSYPKTAAGFFALGVDIVRSVPRHTSWMVASLALVGIVWELVRVRSLDQARALLPLGAAFSYVVLFIAGARRSDDRFLLPLAVLLTPYASIVVDRALRSTRPTVPVLGSAAGILMLVPPLVAVVALDGTLLADPRYEAERYLEALPPGTPVEVFGGSVTLPRLPSNVRATRSGTDDLSSRSPLPDVIDVVDPLMDVRKRGPQYLVLNSDYVSGWLSPTAGSVVGKRQRQDVVSGDFFRSVVGGTAGYERVLRAQCTLPLSLQCFRIPFSTAGEIWIYRVKQF